jgi:hypothetical protein
MSKIWRINGSEKGIAKDSSETQLANPEYFAKDKACFYCKEKWYLKFECLNLTEK